MTLLLLPLTVEAYILRKRLESGGSPRARRRGLRAVMFTRSWGKQAEQVNLSEKKDILFLKSLTIQYGMPAKLVYFEI